MFFLTIFASKLDFSDSMDAARFIADPPGKLVPTDRGDVAFIPDPLPPPDLELPAHLLDRLAAVREAVGELRGRTAALPHPPSILLRPLQREESLRSSSLEGTHATAEELLEFELRDPAAPAPQDAPSREVHNYDLAMQDGQRRLDAGEPIDTAFICALHRQLTEGLLRQRMVPGELRSVDVQIGTTRRYVPPPATSVRPCMDALERFIASPPDLHPILIAALVHYQLEAIHPFPDGNGRVGRLLFSLMLARACALPRPWIHLSEFFEERRDEYIDRLFNVSARAEWSEWLALCLDAIGAQVRRTTDRLAAITDLRARWQRQIVEAGMHARVGSLLDALIATPIIDAATARTITGVAARNTAKADLDALERIGILARIPRRRKRIYLARAALDAAHSPRP